MIAPLPDVATLLGGTPLGNDAESLRQRPPREIVREFEAMLLAQMIAAMRKTVPESALLGASPHRQVLDGVFDLEMARALSTDGGLGVAEALGRQLGLEDEAAEPNASGAGPAPNATAVPFGGPRSIVASPVEAEAAAEGIELPVKGRLSSRFGPRRHPVTGERHFHSGIDVAAPRGTEVAAAAPGKVVEVGRGGPAGRFVRVQHDDGTVSSYAHLDTVRVREGQHVADGEVLATVGSSGRATGPHLHLTVRRDGAPIDPLAWLRGVEENA